MIKFLILLSIFITPFSFAGHVPPDTSPSLAQAGVFRIFYKTGEFANLIEYQQFTKIDKREENSLTLGTRYRLLRNLKLGLFFSRRQGLRHDDDWVQNSSGDWFWLNTNNRSENFSILEISPRYLADFLPGKKWVFELRTRGEHNFENQHNTLKLRPGLTYFWFKEGAPFMNFFLQYEAYIPLNYAESETLYESWIYTGFLFHWSKRFKPGLFFTSYTRKWTPSARFKLVKGAETYTNKESGKILGVNLNFNFN